MATTETLQDRRDALLDEVISYTADMGDIKDAQHAESLDKRRQAINSEAEELKEQMKEDAAAWRKDAEEQTLEAAYEITPGGKKGYEERVVQARSSVKAFNRRRMSNLRNNIATGWTDLPGVISPNAAPKGSGAIPEFHTEETPNKIAGAMETQGGKNAVHEFVQPRLRIPEDHMDMFPEVSIGFVSDKDADGEREEKSYQALALPMSKFLSATRAGDGSTAGAGLVPEATLFQPQVEGLDQFNGPMEMAMWWDVKVTPGDINPMQWLRFTSRSRGAARAENTAKSVTDPTMDEIDLYVKKLAWDGEITKEALMRNYVNDFFGAYNSQALAEFKALTSEQLTKGTGAGTAAATDIQGLIPQIDAVTNVPDFDVTAAAVDALAINQVTLLELKRLIPPGLRREPLIFMARDTIIWELLINQLNATAPGYSLPLDTSMANDMAGYHGKMWGIHLQANEDIDADTTAANNTIGVILAGKSVCVRMTGTTNTLNPWDEMGRDVISVYIRGWFGCRIIKPQVARNFTVARLRTA